ncbi:MAG: HAD family phosphatase [Pararhodobacter sp.]|nr:HAD family phosphatase [Pararhodobacter sp.]
MDSDRTAIKAVVFDIGNVLLQWHPQRAFLPELGSNAAADAFIARVGFHGWNRLNDGGRSRDDALAAVPDPADRALLARYGERFAQTIDQPMPGSWEILHALREQGVPLGAITNFSAWLWPVALRLYPALGKVFGTVVVSGAEGVLKPERAIYRIFCARSGFAPHECLFIDDALENVIGAREAGMEAVQFNHALSLRAALTQAGVMR